MASPIVFRHIARMEMDESIAWYENQRAKLGVEFAVEIDETLQRISRAPELYPRIRGEIRRALVHRFPYAVHYITEHDRIVVLAVFHVKRDPSLLEER